MGEVCLHVELLSHTPDPQGIVAMAAKLCYSSVDIDRLKEGIERADQSSFIAKLMDMGHLSPVEHASFTFGVEGVSRSLLAQITRHRIASFSVKSQRYVTEKSKDGKTFNYIIPEGIKALGQHSVEKFKQQMLQIQEWYDEWLELLGDKGESSNEDARFVLPNAAETKFLVTMNARELLHFFSLRCCNRAQWEIRALAKEMLKLVLPVAPNIFMNAGPACIRGKCPEGSMSCGRAEEVRREFEDIYRRFGGLK
ncbi:MAG: FAD-dependent thymidylate synthase [Clostridiales bacterium]|nr:FAD-dependent thymidylate synthase [Clostridiales bacterium]